MEDVVSPPNPPQDSTKRVRLATGVEAILDARRCIFLPADGILAITDLHLGYSWAQRHRGALMPITPPEATVSRVSSLLGDYHPSHLVILGDLVHEATRQPGIEEALHRLASIIPEEVTWTVCAGNHDRNLGKLLDRLPRPVQLVPTHPATGCLLYHGDTEPRSDLSETFTLEGSPPVHIIGHEHPALRLGDGVATEAKVPCFIVSDEVLVVPAFSDWAAGCDIQTVSFLGPIAKRARFHTAHACLGPRILQVPLHASALQARAYPLCSPPRRLN